MPRRSLRKRSVRRDPYVDEALLFGEDSKLLEIDLEVRSLLLLSCKIFYLVSSFLLAVSMSFLPYTLQVYSDIQDQLVVPSYLYAPSNVLTIFSIESLLS